MWIVNKEKTHVIKATNFWIDNEVSGRCKISAGYGSTADDELWNVIGEYRAERAREIFKELIISVGNVEKFEMPVI